MNEQVNDWMSELEESMGLWQQLIRWVQSFLIRWYQRPCVEGIKVAPAWPQLLRLELMTMLTITQEWSLMSKLSCFPPIYPSAKGTQQILLFVLGIPTTDLHPPQAARAASRWVRCWKQWDSFFKALTDMVPFQYRYRCRCRYGKRCQTGSTTEKGIHRIVNSGWVL